MKGKRLIRPILFVVGLIATFLGAAECYRTVKVQKCICTASANVTEKEMHYSDDGKDYVIRYRFLVAGETFSAGDATGRTNLWTTLPKPRWDALDINVDLPVHYCPDRPQLNYLLEKPPRVFDSITLMVSGLVFLALGIALGVAREHAHE